MNKINPILIFKKFNRSHRRIQIGFAIITIAIVINHLAEGDHFPFSDSYRFPLFPIISSIIMGVLILIIADFNFNYFKEKYFVQKITTKTLIHYLLSTLVYISVMYIPVNYILAKIKDKNMDFYHLLLGLSITLLLSCLFIISLFAKDIYKLHKLEITNGKIKFKRGEEAFLIDYSEILYVYSENKIVYIVKSNGENLITDFTLNEIESKISPHLFFRANRQTILHYDAIAHFKPIENGKLAVTFNPGILKEGNSQIHISRYKKKPFKDWLEHRQ